ncbi:helix-turn-helix transcriptional regulator [Caldifermentibacillus hisashii]|uniref:helix-turn-helix domain-containing protein n=1 Tax=Caldifermentibacillus hisashii TaxID=996558 RepID=UPI002E239A3A|nr:helix-turn-helix transcriptional regulator [Caldifermentibacillus hisashii]
MIDPFCLRLENLREKSGYTKKELSQKLGFSANVYGSYERGERRPSFETCCKLANIFHVSLDYLLCGKEYNQGNIETEESQLTEVIELFKEKGLKHPYILQLDKWEELSQEDLQELTNHFNWVVHKARLRRKA